MRAPTSRSNRDARRKHAPTLPTCSVEPPSLMKGQKWYHVPARRPLWAFRVGDPIVAKEHLDGTESSVMAARKLTAVLRERLAGGDFDAAK